MKGPLLRVLRASTGPRLLPWLGATGAACLFVSIGTLCMFAFQPAEDAYILFRYAKNFAAGAGIVFSPGGPHAEGATDFLWMLGIAGLHAIGIDLVVASLLLNALGAAVASAVMVRAVKVNPSAVQRVLVTCGVVLLVVFFHGALASYRGFSALLFAALAVWLLDEQRRHEYDRDLVPYLALLVALVRPDGAILAIGVAGLEVLKSGKTGLGRLVRSWGPASLLGVAYFAWRWSYFGLLLPLPIYVKARPTAVDSAVADFPMSAVLP